MDQFILEEDRQGKALSEFMRAGARSSGVDASQLGQKPRSGGVHSL